MNAFTNPTYLVLREALLKRATVRCTYHGLVRECCPHTIGTSEGRSRALMFQFAGASSRGLPPGGEWRCMDIALISNISVYDGPWHTGLSHTRPQTCIKNVDVEVMS